MKADRELDAKVAEFMKLTWPDDRCEWCGWPYHEEGVGCSPNNCSQRPLPIKKSTNYPAYSADISAALPVLEKAKKSFFSTTITMWDHTDKVVIVGDKRQGHNENISVLTVQAETLPLAICKFALRTKENENE